MNAIKRLVKNNWTISHFDEIIAEMHKAWDLDAETSDGCNLMRVYESFVDKLHLTEEEMEELNYVEGCLDDDEMFGNIEHIRALLLEDCESTEIA